MRVSYTVAITMILATVKARLCLDESEFDESESNESDFESDEYQKKENDDCKPSVNLDGSVNYFNHSIG